MNDSEVRRVVREEIRQALGIILNAAAGENTQETETVQSLYPGMPGIEGRPVMHPFGLASRAPEGTISVVAQVGDHKGNRMVLGHRDHGRPSDINAGEVVIYNQFGQAVYVRDEKIQVGSKSSENPMVLGDVLMDFITQHFRNILDAPQVGWAGGVIPVFLDPAIRTSMEALLEQFVDEASTNIVSQLTFTERGGS